MNNEFSENGVFLSPSLNRFRNNPILNIKFNIKSGTPNDKRLINQFYSKTIESKYSDSKILSLKETIDELMNLIDLVTKFSINCSETNAALSAGDKEDKIQIDIDFNQRPNYFIFPFYGMFVNPNYIFTGYNYSSYPKGWLFDKLSATQLRVGYGQKKSISFHQIFKKLGKIEPEFVEELSQRELGENITETKNESSMIFRHWINHPSIIFPFHSYADAKSCFYFKLGYKRRRNNVEVRNASNELIKISSNHEKLYGFKFGYSSSCFEDTSFENGSTIDLSAEYNTDYLGLNFAHLSAHFRKFLSIGRLIVQTHAKFDKIVTSNDQNDLMINDRIHLRNFKGIKDVGKKYYKHQRELEINDANNDSVGDCLGHLSLLELGIKITSSDLPLFKTYQIDQDDWTVRPFIFSNIAILPEDMKPDQSFSTHLKENIVASSGLGIQFIHPFACLELYYSAILHKNSYEVGVGTQFNFGLD